MQTCWEEVTLADIIEIKHGYAFKGKFFCDEPTADICLTPGNFAVGGGFKEDKLKYYNGPVEDEYILDEGDLLVTMTDLSKKADTLGYPALVPSPNGRRYLHNQRLGLVEITDGTRIAKEFLYYLFCGRDYRHEVVSGATGTTVKHTSPTKIRAFKTPIPPLEEQRAIASILGALDDKIELNRRMNATLESLARAIFKSWFVDFDPVRRNAAKGEERSGKSENSNSDLSTFTLHDSLFPSSFQDSDLGKIPTGWVVGTIKEAFELTMGQSPPGSTYNEGGEGLPFYQGCRDFGFRFPEKRVYCNAPKRLAQKGDALVSVRAPVGDLNMAVEECCVGRGVAALRHKSGSRSFTYYAMHNLALDFAKYEAEGTVFGSINKKNFEGLQFVNPGIELVEKFEETVAPLDSQIAMLERESSTLSALRDTLLPKLLSGELPVPTELTATHL